MAVSESHVLVKCKIGLHKQPNCSDVYLGEIIVHVVLILILTLTLTLSLREIKANPLMQQSGVIHIADTAG